jgi:hypothetical protein
LRVWDIVVPMFWLQELLFNTINTLQATGTTHLCPDLCDVPALLLVFWVFFELLVFLLDIFFYGKSRAEVNWGMGVYAPLHREIYPRSPALLFRCHTPPYHTKIVNGESKANSDRAPERSVFGTRAIWSVATTKSTFLCGGAAARFFGLQSLAKARVAHSSGPSRKKSTIVNSGNPRNQICRP